jgi:pimeloyl-ACP methyl ester carboxylesterase
VLVLVHGIASSSGAWGDVLPTLARRFTVLAPDLMGHGQSAKPRGDYSLGAYASGIRDLMIALGYEGATFVGHSLGGGVAMQLAYQFPERCERLVLISSGGLGREVHLLLRAAALPGSEYVIPVIAAPALLRAGAAVGSFFGRLGIRPGPDIAEFGRGYASLGDVETRQAFIQTLRAVVEPGGQRRPRHPRRARPPRPLRDARELLPRDPRGRAFPSARPTARARAGDHHLRRLDRGGAAPA